MTSDNEQMAFNFDSGVLPEWARQIAVFDTETTGLNLKSSRIVTACVAVLDQDGNLLAPAQEWLADPGIEIPEAAADVHGVTTEFARANGADAKQVVSEIIDALRELQNRGIPIVAYNAPYDFTILHWEAVRHGLEPLVPALVLDPLVIDKFVDKYRKGPRKLEVTAQFYGVELGNAHNATADAIASGRVMQAIAAKHADKLGTSLIALQGNQARWADEAAISFAKWKRDNGSPDFREELGWPVRQG
ncbi:MAG: exonuclease domain-containing protein [Micrococcales bacterium]